MTIIIKNKETLLIDDFKFRCSVGKGGSSKNKIEGDLKSPIGIFELGNIYYRPDKVEKPKSKIKTIPIKIEKLLEIININFLKNKFNNQSNIKIGKYNLDINSRKITFNDKSLDLTERETSLIIFIKDETNVSVKQLQKNVWDYSPSLETHTVETHIYRLRKKMKDIFGDDNFILNSSKGYSIN